MLEEIKKGMDRRSFFRWSGLSFLGMMVLDKVRPSLSLADQPKDYWNDEGYFHQDKVDSSKLDQGIIRAKGLENKDNNWADYNVVDAEQWFWEWNFSERVERLDKMIYNIENNISEPPQWGGAHNPSVASHSMILPDDDAFNRSNFSLNNAIKGMGLGPKEEHIDGMLADLVDPANWDAEEIDRVHHLKSIYTNRDLWDTNKQISLELYATPERLTHSFINWMNNPLANISFMALRMRFAFPPYFDPVPGPAPVWMPTYELRTCAHMIHPLDPAFDDGNYEFKLTKFSNTIHDFFHHTPGQLPPEREDMDIGVIHYILEEFDNDFVGGKSTRVAWLRILDWPKSLYAKFFGKTKQMFAKASGRSRIA